MSPTAEREATTWPPAERLQRAPPASAVAPPAAPPVFAVGGEDVAVEGADEDGWRAVPGVGDGGAGVGVAAGRIRPGESAVAEVIPVDAAGVVAGVSAAVGDRGGRVELAGAAEAGPQRAGLPEQLAGPGVDRVHV